MSHVNEMRCITKKQKYYIKIKILDYFYHPVLQKHSSTKHRRNKKISLHITTWKILLTIIVFVIFVHLLTHLFVALLNMSRIVRI